MHGDAGRDEPKAAYNKRVLKIYAALLPAFLLGLVIGLPFHQAKWGAALGGIVWGLGMISYMIYGFITDRELGIRRYFRR